MNVFEETQRPSSVLFGFGVVVIAFAAGWALWLSERLDKILWAQFALPAFAALVLVVVRMTTTVTSEHIRVVLLPFPRKTFALAEIERWDVVTYRPMLHYGGWGWRWSPSRGSAYTMSGNRGVMVHPRNGKAFLIGSQRPEELAAAIEAAKRGRTSGA